MILHPVEHGVAEDHVELTLHHEPARVHLAELQIGIFRRGIMLLRVIDEIGIGVHPQHKPTRRCGSQLSGYLAVATAHVQDCLVATQVQARNQFAPPTQLG